MDWNMFFATISQVTATIVAIWGAFIISKILNNETAFNNKKSKNRIGMEYFSYSWDEIINEF